MDFTNTYLTLGERFYQKSQPTPVESPQLFLWNGQLAKQLRIPYTLQEDSETLAQFFCGNQMIDGAEPIATAYAGHQFGHFNPQLGDGRAHLLGELTDDVGKGWDIQLKGSGPSAFSRSGDGRCAIGPAVREFIMSEAMKALGVPTTQCLAVVTTGESVFRQRALPGAVVTRVASSHIRVGNFQYFSARGDIESLKALCEYSIERHYPHINEQEGNRYILLLDNVIEKQIQLMVEWMRVGFIHGVMNTDNTAISGETIDYGPCAMMGIYHPQTVYSSIDRDGRYAFGNQPNIAHWNMARFAECLLQLSDKDDQDFLEQVQSKINAFPDRFEKVYMRMMANKFGITECQDGDDELILSLLEQLNQQKMDYTISFDLLTKSLTSDSVSEKIKAELGELSFDQWRARLDQQNVSVDDIHNLMRRNNPAVIPRNHHIEAVIKACEDTGSAHSAEALLNVLRCPYDETEKTRQYQKPSEDNDKYYQTFCGT